MGKIAVVIPSYEDSQCLSQCLHSLRKHLTTIDYKVVVVDNASKKPEVIRLLADIEKDNKIIVVRNSVNLGFSKAINQGIAALNTTSMVKDFFLILNQDSSLMDGNILTALDLMDQNPRIGVCGPRLHNGDGTVQNSFYAFPSPTKKMAQLAGMKKLGSLFRKVNLSPDLFFLPSFAANYLWNYKESSGPIEVPWSTGACLLIRKKAFDELTGFDENIWMYAEDMDLCFRARAMDWTIVFCPDWHVCHHGGKPFSRLSEELLRIYYDSLSYFYTKHFRGAKKVYACLKQARKGKSLEIREKGKSERQLNWTKSHLQESTSIT